MRVLVENYGDVRIFKDRPYGYKRFIVEWKEGGTQIYSGIWYKEEQIKRKVEKEIDKAKAEIRISQTSIEQLNSVINVELNRFLKLKGTE